MTTGVSNGRGGFLGNGTNAPLYTTTFTAARPKAHDDTERHEGRLAEALEIDRAQRILEFRDLNPSPLRYTLNEKHHQSTMYTKTVWRGGEWIMGGPEISMPATLSATCLLLLMLRRDAGHARAQELANRPIQISPAFSLIASQANTYSQSSMLQTCGMISIALFWHTRQLAEPLR